MGAKAYHRLLRPWTAVRLLGWLTTASFGWVFLAIPLFICRRVPHCPAMLSMAFLYIFFQALGLLWVLVITLCSVCSVQLTKKIQAHLSGETPKHSDVVRVMLSGYVIYCILRILFFVGASFYTLGWEAFTDFPMVRKLIIGKKGDSPDPGHTTGASSNDEGGCPDGGRTNFDDACPSFHRYTSNTSESTCRDSSPERRCSSPEPPWSRPYRERLGRKAVGKKTASTEDAKLQRFRNKRQRFFREVTLFAPLLGLIACELTLFTVTATCQIRLLPCEVSVFTTSIAEPTSRLNKGIRFALFVSFLQWIQQFCYIFPQWHRGLLATTVGSAWGLAALPLAPALLCHIAWQRFVTADAHASQYILGALTHHTIDTGIMLFLEIWMLVCCLFVFRKPEVSGFNWQERPLDHRALTEMAILFKFTFLVPTSLRFAWGCLKLGFMDAQNDLLVIIFTYPLLLWTVWTMVWAVVVAPGKRHLLAAIAMCLSLASTICSAVGTRQVAAAIVVFLHLMRRYLLLLHQQKNQRRAHRRSSAFPQGMGNGSPMPTLSAAKIRAHHSGVQFSPSGSDQEYFPARRWANRIILSSMMFCAFLFSILAGLTVMSGIQEKKDWYPTFIWFEREEKPPALFVDHTVSRLRLQIRATGANGTLGEAAPPLPAATDGDADVSYAVCDHQWHGLNILDYALLSLASYFDVTDPGLQHFLDGAFPAGSGLRWHRNHTSSKAAEKMRRISWIEVEFEGQGAEKPVLVIAVRGTDPIRVSDLIEDIRMWTEPVAFSILSTLFPTVRMWPRRTVEMVITGIHDFLSALGMPSDDWSYTYLLNRISEVPRERYGKIVLTGHSLGGAVAAIVGVMTRLPVVVISPPGIYWSLAKYFRHGSGPAGGATGKDASSWMHHQSLTLMVENDWINGIVDDHGGLVQMMTCDRPNEAVSMACHAIEGTICHIFSRCGDPLRRWASCTHEYVIKDYLISKLVKMLHEMLPPRIGSTLGSLWTWSKQPLLPSTGAFANPAVPLCVFFLGIAILVVIIEKFCVF